MPRPKGYRAQSIPQDDARLPDIVKRLKGGETSLGAESEALGFSHNGPLRKALRDRLGAEAYGQLMEGKHAEATARWREKQVAAKDDA